VRIPIDRSSEVPLYQQIEDFLRQNILSGKLEPGTRLPATRQLAAELGVSRITVKNAYAELEGDGLVDSMEGSGTFVMEVHQRPNRLITWEPEAWPLWQQELQGEDQSNLAPQPTAREPHPRMISFTGVGDPELFPLKEFSKTMQTVIKRDGVDALLYGDFNAGYAPLRKTITRVLASQGIQANPEQVLITSGSQQGIALVCQILLKPGDVVIVENPTYNLALELFRALRLKIVGVPVDESGMQVAKLEALLQRYHPRLIYTIPNFQNPTGASLSGARRRALLALADRYHVPILEDDFAGDLRYEGTAQPAIKVLDPGGRVIYTGTFSKMLMPGLRVGFLVAEGPVFPKLVQAKRVSDLTTSTLMQRTLNEYVTVGRYQVHLRRSCRVYRKRRDAMLSAIRHYCDECMRVYITQGGLFLWFRLPEGMSSTQLLPLALEEGVDYAPGSRFFVNPEEGERFLRLNFATQSEENIEAGIQRLVKAIDRLRK
jgi:GntR family transcriptional regulator / MocR family aminotransferase